MRLEVFFLDSAEAYKTEQVPGLLAKHDLGSVGSGFEGIRVSQLLRAVLNELRSELADLEGKIVIDGDGRLLSPDCLLTDLEGCVVLDAGMDRQPVQAQAPSQTSPNTLVRMFHLKIRACTS